MPEVCPHTDGDKHDCGYVRRRNNLIPEAERIARQRCVTKGLDFNSAAFNREFFDAMDELARASGLLGVREERAAA